MNTEPTPITGAPLSEMLRKCIANLQSPPKPEPTASDDDVADQFCQMALYSDFEPAEQFVEPVRAFLAGFGLLLSGDAGVGKTFLLTALGVRLYTAVGIAEYGLSRIGMWYEWTDNAGIGIDDLGTESTVSEYGNKDDLMKLVIAHRADRQRGRTFVSTNLSAEQIAERYGDRTLSRLLGMCKAFTLRGESRRTARAQQ
jgi:DNA replication protein DnaC